MAPYEKEAFKYCMVCGNEFETVSIIEKHCPKCNYRYFISAKPSSSALIFNSKNELLMIKRGRDPHKGTWDIPAGFSDDFETLEDTLVREMKEEINYTVKSIEYFKSYVGDYEYKGIIKRYLSACFIINMSDEDALNIKAGDDAEEIKWVPLDKIDYSEIGFETVKQRIEDYTQHLTSKI